MSNLFDIKNKIFIIVGASSGIGKKLSEVLPKYGAKVYGFARRKSGSGSVWSFYWV